MKALQLTQRALNAGAVAVAAVTAIGDRVAERIHCLGIIRLEKKFGRERLDAACARALAVNGRSYKHVESILHNGLDRVALPKADEPTTSIDHENVRGPDYYN